MLSCKIELPQQPFEITERLLRGTAKKCPQPIKDTPVVLFCRAFCIYLRYLQKTGGRLLSKNYSLLFCGGQFDTFAMRKGLDTPITDTRLGSSFHQKKQRKQYIYILTDLPIYAFFRIWTVCPRFSAGHV